MDNNNYLLSISVWHCSDFPPIANDDRPQQGIGYLRRTTRRELNVYKISLLHKK